MNNKHFVFLNFQTMRSTLLILFHVYIQITFCGAFLLTFYIEWVLIAGILTNKVDWFIILTITLWNTLNTIQIRSSSRTSCIAHFHFTNKLIIWFWTRALRYTLVNISEWGTFSQTFFTIYKSFCFIYLSTFRLALFLIIK